MLQSALSLKKEVRKGVMQKTDNDQWILSCGMAQVAHEGEAKVWLLPKDAFTFGTLGWVNFQCGKAANTTWGEIPYYGAANEIKPFAYHVSTGTSFDLRDNSHLKTLGFWDLND